MDSRIMELPVAIKAKRNVSTKPVNKTNGFPIKNTRIDRIPDISSSGHDSMSSRLRRTLEEFTATTTLHGFRFLLNKKYTKIERFWWLVMVLCSITMGSYLISKIWLKWIKSPVVLNIADISTSVWQIPFPAVTICTEIKPKQRLFNFTKAFHERWGDPTSISENDLKLYHDMLLVCQNPADDGPEFADSSSIETICRVAPSQDEIFLRCKWGHYSCDELFFPTITRDGYCFTFNMVANEEMFRTENLHNDYMHTETHKISNWSLELGYSYNASIYTYPFRGLVYSFEVILLTDLRDVDPQCRGSIQGFKIWLHNPAELPNMRKNFFRLPIEHQSHVMVTPRLTLTSTNLRHYTPEQRQCYFTDERYLMFFRTYTEKNCELECSANYTAKQCDCVPHYMPHGPNTKVCGGGKKACVKKALVELSVAQAGLDVEFTKDIDTCGCLQACTELKYDTEVSQAVIDDGLFGNVFNSSNIHGWRLPSGLTINFAKEKSMALQRSEVYATVEFLAHCGGIMGLFIGFSILSFIEIVFFFTLRLWSLGRKQ